MSPAEVPDAGGGPRLERALRRLDTRIDWERRERSSGARPMRQTLEPVRDLFARLGHPERAQPAVLIAGTKGKGSVASLVAAGLRRAGLADGLYTSPHVERVHERIRIGGREIDDERLAHALERAFEALDAAVAAASAGADASWFDVLTAAALAAFRDARVDMAVLECGLGGRLDSTNAVDPALSVVTNIDLEHTAILGSTRAAIAREKAHVARRGRPLVTAIGPPGDEAADAAAEVARAIGAVHRPVELAPGSIEASNLELASVVLDELGARLDPRGGRRLGRWALDERARTEARLPGRLERFEVDGTPIVLDGAHVPSSLRRVLADLRALGLDGPAVVVIGMGIDKDADGLLKALQGSADRVLCTSAGRGPYRDPEELAGRARALGFDARSAPDPRQALDEARGLARDRGWVLVTGSLHVVGRVRGPLARPPAC